MTRTRFGDTEVERQIGARIRRRRLQIGISQEALGGEVGVSFQQIQKYERGIDRISASRLLRVVQALGVTPAWLLDGLDADDAAATEPEFDRATRDLLRAFGQIEDPAVKKSVLTIVHALAQTTDTPDKDEDGLPHGRWC